MKKQLLTTIFISTVSLYGCQTVSSPVLTVSPSPTASPTPLIIVSSSPAPTPVPAQYTPLPSPSVSQNSYNLPLTALWRMEAGPTTIVEVKQDGTYNYQQQGIDLYNRKLSTDEINKLKTLLNQLDFAKLAEGDTTATHNGIPGIGDDYTMIVNGNEQTYSTKTFPNIAHTQAYIDAAGQLRSYLEALKK